MSAEHASMGFPNGAVNLPTIFGLPSSGLLMLMTEARYHLGEAQAAGKRVWCRAIPNRGQRPAELSWDHEAIAREVTAQVYEAIYNGGAITDFIPLNELDLQDERGDHEDDYDETLLGQRYQQIGIMLAALLPVLRQTLPPGCKIWFPPFTPDHYALQYSHLWADTARMYDGIVIHAYNSEAEIASAYGSYRDVFPSQELIIGEWQCKSVEEEHRVLTWAMNAMRSDSHLQGLFFFIWRWDNAPGWWSDAYDVAHNPDRLDLFMNPPMPNVLPIPPITPVEPDMPDYRQMARDAGYEAGIDGETFQRQIGVESWDYDLDVIECRLDSREGAQGIAQIVPRWHPSVNPCNPPEALDYAAQLMASYLQAYNGDWALALSAYNAGPGATNRGLAGRLDGWPYAETVSYVSRILAISEDAAAARLTRPVQTQPPAAVVPPPTDGRVYGPDVPDDITLQQNDWTCAVRSLYVALYQLAEKGLIEPVTYGDGGPRDVYDALVPLYDSATVGLHDGSGKQMAEVIKNQFGVDAVAAFPVSLEQVQAHAGLNPILIGGQAWGHWVEVRGVEDDGTLILENPAPGWMGIGNELRDSFERLGPFAMVVLDAAPITDPGEMEDEVTKAEADALRHENETLRTIVGYLQGDVNGAAQKEVDQILASIGALQAALNTLRNTPTPLSGASA